ncbi:MAG: hypothetical protein ACE5G2_13710, partial [Candidatus Krumholzibacteriia bacterium]
MPQIFHHSTNTISRISIFGAVFFLGALVWVLAMLDRSSYWTGQTDRTLRTDWTSCSLRPLWTGRTNCTLSAICSLRALRARYGAGAVRLMP